MIKASLKSIYRDFPGGPAVRNSPANAEGQSPVQEDPTCLGQVTPCAGTAEPAPESLSSTRETTAVRSPCTAIRKYCIHSNQDPEPPKMSQ